MKTAQPYKMRVPFPALKTMVTVFLLLMGNTSPVHPVAISTVAGIASAAVSAGISLAGTTLQGLAATGYRVTCAIEVENWTRYPLVRPSVKIANSGALTTPPRSILPGKREAFATRKPGHTATGVYGTVSWELLGANRRFVLMWDAPYSFDFHSNWMGLGMTREGLVTVAHDDDWYDQMYDGGSSYDLTFKRRKFRRNTHPVIYRNDKFEVEGVMTNIHRAEIKVIVRPTEDNWKDLAPSIRLLLEQQQKRALQRDN